MENKFKVLFGAAIFIIFIVGFLIGTEKAEYHRLSKNQELFDNILDSIDIRDIEKGELLDQIGKELNKPLDSIDFEYCEERIALFDSVSIVRDGFSNQLDSVFNLMYGDKN